MTFVFRFDVTLAFAVSAMMSACAWCGEADERTVQAVLSEPVLEASAEFSSWDGLYGRLDARDRAADEVWRTLTSEAAYDAHRRALRDRFVERIGGFPERTPLNVRMTGRSERKGYAVEKILFESRPGAYVTALLYLPDPRRFPPPCRAAVGLSGHSADGKGAKFYRRVCVLMAKSGVAALFVDPLSQGERAQCAEDDDRKTTKAHLRLGVNALLLGHGLAAFEMWDAVRALDCLDARPDVRHDGYGVFGNSGGGTQSAMLAGLDRRIVATATCCFLSNLRRQTADRLLADSEQLVFGQLADGLNHAAYPLMGGRPVLMLARQQDMIPYAGTCETYRLLATVADRIGAPGRYDFFSTPGPHGYDEPTMRRSAAYLSGQLCGAAVEIPAEDDDFGPEGDAARVTATGRVRDLPGFRSAYDYLAEELSAAEAVRRHLPAADRAAEVRRLADIDETRVGFRQVLKETRENGITVLRTAYPVSDGYRLPAVECVPDVVLGAPVLLVGDGPRTEQAKRAAELLTAGRPVLVADLTACGEIGKARHHYVNPHDDEETAKMLYLLGSSLVGRRAGEALALGRDLRARYGRNPDLVARGRTCVAAAHAKAADPALFASVELQDAPLSWAQSVRARAFYDYAASVHGALRHYDWTDLVSDGAGLSTAN